MDSSSVARPDARDAKTQRHAELQALLGRVEAATGADRELDFALARWQGWTTHTDEADPVFTGRVSTWWARPGGEWDTTSVPPAYTRSLDAALALVERIAMPEPDFDICFRQMGRGQVRWFVPECGHWLVMEGATQPLALLAALLKALLPSEEQPSVCEQREQAAPATATPQ